MLQLRVLLVKVLQEHEITSLSGGHLHRATKGAWAGRVNSPHSVLILSKHEQTVNSGLFSRGPLCGLGCVASRLICSNAVVDVKSSQGTVVC